MEGLISGGLLNKQERRSTSKQAIISADQNTVCIYWFLIKLQNFIMNWIHFNSFGGGWQSDVFVCLFVCLFVQGHPTTVFCEISVRRSKYCLEFSFAWGRLVNFQMNVPFKYNFQSLSNKFPTIFWSLIFHNLRPWLHCFS